MTRASRSGSRLSALAVVLVLASALLAPGCGLLAPLDPLNEYSARRGGGGSVNTGGNGATGANPGSTGGSSPVSSGGQSRGGETARGGVAAGGEAGSNASGGGGAGAEGGAGEGGADGGGADGGGAGASGAGAGGEAPTRATLGVSQFNVCAIVGGVIRCWGGAEALGDGRPPREGVGVASPVSVADITDAVDIGLGTAFACALRANKTVWCWGEGGDGQLGDGVFHRDEMGIELPASRPQPVLGIATAIDVAVGDKHACALLEGGRVKCWGSDRRGQLGDEDPHGIEPFGSATPVNVLGLTNAVQIAAQASQSCALLADETVVCWGLNAVSQSVPERTPTAVPDAVDVVSVTCGANHACIVNPGGSASCWGDGDFGQLGNEDFFKRQQATPVIGIADVTQLAAGLHHSCALLSDRTARCWGRGDEGELGDGTVHSSPSHDIAQVDLAGIDELAAAVYTTCARVESSRIFCWGDGALSTLGNPSILQSLSPVEIHGVVP